LTFGFQGGGFLPLTEEIGNSYELSNTKPSEKEQMYKRGVSFVASTDFLFNHWKEILDILKESKEDVYDDEIPITQLAEENAKKLLHIAFEELGLRLQIPNIIPTDSGGIEVEWKKGGKYLQLICPPNDDKKPYLFYKEDDNYGIQHFEDSNEFVKRINWLIEN
jgi:hypothetical protein